MARPKGLGEVPCDLLLARQSGPVRSLVGTRQLSDDESGDEQDKKSPEVAITGKHGLWPQGVSALGRAAPCDDEMMTDTGGLSSAVALRMGATIMNGTPQRRAIWNVDPRNHMLFRR